MSPFPILDQVSASPDQPVGGGRRLLSDRLAARRGQLIDHLAEPIIVAETVEALGEQANDIYQAFKPRNGWQDWLTSTIATLMIRINRCERVERRMRDWASYRAIDFWEDDQQLEVETLATKLDRDPSRVVAKLKQSPTGCQWLLARWRLLARIEPQHWTDEQRTLAGRLVGANPDVDPTAPGFAAGQVRALETLRGRVEEADAILRGLVEADLSDEAIPGLSKLRRYSRSLHRQMKWYIDQFHVEHPDRWDDPMRQPGTISRDLIREELCRKPKWSFRPPTPRINKTNPLAGANADSHHENDETKPSCPEPPSANDETKPSVRVELIARLAAAVPPAVAEAAPGFVHDDSNEQIRQVDRPRRANLVLEATRCAKANRRRVALA